jgi:hypothetical protein
VRPSPAFCGPLLQLRLEEKKGSAGARLQGERGIFYVFSKIILQKYTTV